MKDITIARCPQCLAMTNFGSPNYWWCGSRKDGTQQSMVCEAAEVRRKEMPSFLIPENKRLQKSDKIVQLIEELRGDGSDYLTLHCKSRPGDEGLREAVDVVADWTNFEEQWFWGDTLEGALQSAVDAKAAAQAKKHSTE